MIAKDLVSELIPPLKTSDTGTLALNWMNEFHVDHLPVVDGQTFLGLIAEDDILDFNDPNQPIANHILSLHKPYVKSNQHIYDVIKLASDLKLTLVPVIDEEENYLGIVTSEELVRYFSQISAVTTPGGILVLEINVNDYALSEIARIVESNDAKVLSLYVTTHANSTQMEVTLKVNLADLKHLIATFERFKYIVKASFQEKGYYDDLKDNYDSLMKYLNI